MVIGCTARQVDESACGMQYPAICDLDLDIEERAISTCIYVIRVYIFFYM